MSEDRIAAIRRDIEFFDRRIREEKERADALLEEFRGDHEASAVVLRQMRSAVENLLQGRAAARQLLPPFMTEENGILCAHPVTPENRHLLWD